MGISSARTEKDRPQEQGHLIHKNLVDLLAQPAQLCSTQVGPQCHDRESESGIQIKATDF